MQPSRADYSHYLWCTPWQLPVRVVEPFLPIKCDDESDEDDKTHHSNSDKLAWEGTDPSQPFIDAYSTLRTAGRL
jgi:hypothetical protein